MARHGLAQHLGDLQAAVAAHDRAVTAPTGDRPGRAETPKFAAQAVAQEVFEVIHETRFLYGRLRLRTTRSRKRRLIPRTRRTRSCTCRTHPGRVPCSGPGAAR